MNDTDDYAMAIIICIALVFFVLSFADAIDHGKPECGAPKAKQVVRL